MGLKKRYVVYKTEEEGYDDYNNPITIKQKVKEIDMIVVVKQHTVIENGLDYTLVKHLGLTTFKDLHKDYIVSLKEDENISFTVEFVNNVARLSQVNLREVKL